MAGRFGRAALATVAVLAVLATVVVVPARRASADTTFDQHVLELINRDRAANGLNPVVADPTLGSTAESGLYLGCGFPVSGRAFDMGQRNYFSHTILGCGTQSVFSILNALGLVYSGAGENIAWASGLTDPLTAAENLHNQWMNSPDHRANVLNPNYNAVGIGSWHTASGQTWSGGGVALANVYVGVEVFATEPSLTTTTTTVAPTTTTTVAPTTTTTVPPATSGGFKFHPLSPSRILDTRVGNGAPTAPLGAGATMNLQVTGRGGVPSTGASAVVVNVTVTNTTAPSWLTVYPAGEARPMAANLNYVAGQTIPNLVTAKLGANGQISLYNAAGNVDVVADVAGWYDDGTSATGAKFHALTPSRILDTRSGNGAPTAPLGPGATMNLQVSGRGGVPSTGASAVVVNVTVTGTTAPSWLTVYPTGESQPLAANLNYVAGQTIPNLVIAKLGANGQISLYNAAGSTDVVADVTGWYDDGTSSTGSTFHPVTPSRILDTRYGNGAPTAPLGTGVTMNLQVTGSGGVPSTGVSAVVVNVTVTGTTAPSWLTVWPAGEARPMAASLNYVAGQTIPNLVTAKLGTNGQISMYNAFGSTDLVADVAGWFDVG